VTQEFEERLVVRPFELVEFQIDQKVVGEEILLDLVLRLVCYEPPGVVEMPALNLFYYPSQSLSQATSDTQQNIPARALRVCPSESSSSRPQDRIGLVVFSVNAYLVNPLTTDHLVLSEYIEMMDGNTLIGEGLTSVGEGLRLFNDLLSFFWR